MTLEVFLGALEVFLGDSETCLSLRSFEPPRPIPDAIVRGKDFDLVIITSFIDKN